MNTTENTCIARACGREDALTYLPVMAFVEKQVLQTVFEPDKALHCGTLFPELYKPFKGGCRHG